MPERSHYAAVGSKLAAQGGVRFAFFAFVALVATWPILLSAGSQNEFRDALVLLHYEEVARKTLLDFHELPLWNPYYCGGLYGLGAPQARFASPTLLLTALFGSHRGDALACFSLLLLGLEGAYRYARSRGAGALGSMFAAPVFGLSGFFAGSSFLGWTNFFSFAALPFAMWGVRRAARGSLRGAVVLGLSTAWMAGFGGTYSVPIAAVLCGAEVVEALVTGRRRFGRVLTGVAAGGLMVLGLSAFRLWPLMETISRAPRIIGGMSGHRVDELLPWLFGAPPLTGNFTWHLVGIFAAPVMAASLLALRRSLAPLLIAGGCFWVALGYSITPSAFALLRKIPVYETLRYPDRFLIPVALLLSALAARGLTRLLALQRRRGHQPSRLRPLFRYGWAIAAVLLLANLPLLFRNWHQASSQRSMGMVADTTHHEFRQSRGSRWALGYFTPQDLGVLSCWEGYPVPQSRLLRGDLAAEEYLEDPAAGTVRRTRWTPNSIELSVDLAQPARLLVNQNHHTGWRSSVGAVVDREGLLAVELPAGKHEVRLRFLPQSALAGGLTSLAAVAVGVWFWRRGRVPLRTSQRLLLCAVGAAPLLLGGVAAALIAEPRPPASVLSSKTGVPILADALPAGARRVDVHFEHGVNLDGFKSEWTERDGELSLLLEVDWRLTKRPPPGYGFFVHVHPEGGDRVTADHPMVSGALSLDVAPLQKTLRDVLVISAANKHRGKNWDVFVGLWHLHGDGSRLKVADRGSADVDDHRVLVFRGPVPAAPGTDAGVEAGVDAGSATPTP